MPDKNKKIRFDDPKTREQKIGKGERAIEIDEELWTFKVGTQNILIRSPDRHSYIVGLDKSDDHNIKLEITPAKIEEYIRSNFLKDYRSR